MNPVTSVLCVAAICLSIEGYFGWAGSMLFAAFLMALLEAFGRVAIWKKILKR